MLRGNFNTLASHIDAVFKARHSGRSEVRGSLETGGQNRMASSLRRGVIPRKQKRGSASPEGPDWSGGGAACAGAVGKVHSPQGRAVAKAGLGTGWG